MIQLGQQGHLHTKTVELEKVKRNRTALDIKSRFVFIYEEALVQGPRKIDNWGGTYSYIRVVHH